MYISNSSNIGMATLLQNNKSCMKTLTNGSNVMDVGVSSGGSIIVGNAINTTAAAPIANASQMSLVSPVTNMNGGIVTTTVGGSGGAVLTTAPNNILLPAPAQTVLITNNATGASSILTYQQYQQNILHQQPHQRLLVTPNVVSMPIANIVNTGGGLAVITTDNSAHSNNLPIVNNGTTLTNTTNSAQGAFLVTTRTSNVTNGALANGFQQQFQQQISANATQRGSTVVSTLVQQQPQQQRQSGVGVTTSKNTKNPTTAVVIRRNSNAIIANNVTHRLQHAAIFTKQPANIRSLAQQQQQQPIIVNNMALQMINGTGQTQLINVVKATNTTKTPTSGSTKSITLPTPKQLNKQQICGGVASVPQTKQQQKQQQLKNIKTIDSVQQPTNKTLVTKTDLINGLKLNSSSSKNIITSSNITLAKTNTNINSNTATITTSTATTTITSTTASTLNNSRSLNKSAFSNANATTTISTTTTTTTTITNTNITNPVSNNTKTSTNTITHSENTLITNVINTTTATVSSTSCYTYAGNIHTNAKNHFTNDVVVEQEAEPEIDIVINNVVCSFSVRCHLNLREIALRGSNVEYRRENGMVTMKLRRPYTTASIWSSGRVTCTGATSEDQAKIAGRRYARCLQSLGFRVRFHNFRVVNVLGTCSMPWAIKIVNFSEKYKREASYEPELHPGVTYKLRFPKATLKIFSTGSITVTAASVANVQAAIEYIYPLVYEFRKKRSPEEQELLRQKQQHTAGLLDITDNDEVTDEGGNSSHLKRPQNEFSYPMKKHCTKSIASGNRADMTAVHDVDEDDLDEDDPQNLIVDDDIITYDPNDLIEGPEEDIGEGL